MSQTEIVKNINEIKTWLDNVDVEYGGNDNAIDFAIEELEYLESMLDSTATVKSF